ncbi:predicted protein [Arabidopsis lyrata subsp. lyrata]|uniref:Predicted protein n=1 Tax=Arabidopsis lyrata subsp. lyrata TaxID=81972 RepID=D7MTE5_ARALL|nr:predicted protein [Arabidopsis lyrata subsp. lyrata]
MVHTIAVFGDWMLKNVWHFTIDQTKGSKLLVLVDDMSYAGLLQIVEEEYQLDMKRKGEENRKVSLVNELFATSGEKYKVQVANELFATRGEIRDHVDLGDQYDKNDGGDNNNILSSNNTDIKVGEYFKSKYEIQQRLWMLSVKYKFGWRVSKSDPTKLVVVCKNNGCSWRVLADINPQKEMP